MNNLLKREVEMNEIMDKLDNIQRFIEMENSFLDFLPGLEEVNKDNYRLVYSRIEAAFTNIYEMNQKISNDVGTAYSFIGDQLDEIQEEMKDD